MVKHIAFLFVFLCWFVVSCENKNPSTEEPSGQEVTQDGTTETTAPTEPSKELVPEKVPETTPEPVPDDAISCEMPKVPELQIDPKADKFALTMFHYNLEYVVGGLNGTDKYAGFCGEACDEWTNDKVEDWIIRESFLPVVDFYLKHPEWKVNFEMQGYMLEVIAKRFPDLLVKLRTLTGRGQMEISSFHYSDQLFLAFPREDLERSVKITKDIFQKYCIPLSGVVFNQEGQAGEGRQKFLVKHGYTIGVFPKNLFKYVRGEQTEPWPLYQQAGGYLIVGPGGVDPTANIKLNWLFFDDGELLVVRKNLNPYFAPGAGFDPTLLTEYENKIKAAVDQGYKIAHISEYVKHLEAQKFQAKPAPPLLDGTWQPKSTSSIHRWLGGRGLFPQERDNEVRAGNMAARTKLRAVELLYLDWKKQKGADAKVEATLEALWRRMLRAQVSDATGVNPWAGEINWGLTLNAEVQQKADELLKDLKTRRNAAFVQINLQDGSVKDLTELPKPPPLQEVQMPLQGFEVVAKGRDPKTTVYQVDGQGSHFRVRIDFGAGIDEREHRSLTVRFPRSEERIIYSPGLMDDELVDYPMSDFVFQEKEVYLPLPNGLIGLGGDWYAIKHTRTNHLAVRIPQEEKWMEFIDNTQPHDQPVTWWFDLFKGKKEDALKQALQLNIFPTVVH